MTEDYERIADNYTKALAASMQNSKDVIAEEWFKRAVRRSKEQTEYLHGATDAIHEITKTV